MAEDNIEIRKTTGHTERLTEGKVRKGGQNAAPTTPRPVVNIVPQASTGQSRPDQNKSGESSGGGKKE